MTSCFWHVFVVSVRSIRHEVSSRCLFPHVFGSPQSIAVYLINCEWSYWMSQTSADHRFFQSAASVRSERSETAAGAVRRRARPSSPSPAAPPRPWEAPVSRARSTSLARSRERERERVYVGKHGEAGRKPSLSSLSVRDVGMSRVSWSDAFLQFVQVHFANWCN